MVNEPSTAWRLVKLSYQSVFENLALEETLARSFAQSGSSPTIRLWRNPQAVILGRFQDAEAEADIELCRRNGIAIARRFSGGGAVYHDLGTLNLTLVTPPPVGVTLKEIHERNSLVILDLLQRLGLEGTFAPPNSIHVDGRKIAGSAAALGQHFALLHSSILVSTDLDALQRALAPSREFKQTSSIRSNWHAVTTLARILGRHVELEAIEQSLLQSCASVLNARVEKGGLLDEEERMSKRLHERKYSLRDWNWNRNCVERDLGGKSEGAHTTIAV